MSPRSTRLLIVALLAACGRPAFYHTHNHVIGYRLNNTNYFFDARQNYREAIKRYRDKEWRFNKHDKDKPPALCLALSGGGSRSAAFAMGVMRGLAERKGTGSGTASSIRLPPPAALEGNEG